MLGAVSEDITFKELVAVVGYYRDRVGDIEWMRTEEVLEERITAGKVAYNPYNQAEEMINVPAVSQTRMEVIIPGKFVWDWYHIWSDKGVWVNNYLKMSGALLFDYHL